MIKIAASLLNADFARLGEEVRSLEEAGVDSIHLDVMDGHFVPNLTFGPLLAASLRRVTRLPFDVHLMVAAPERFLEEFAAAGASFLTVHAEACPHLSLVLKKIKSLGVKAGVALNPATPLCFLEEVLEEIDLALVMSVNPGWGGQEFLEGVCRKIARLRALVEERKKSVLVQVDGGINLGTVEKAAAAGADFLVVGSALFRERDLASFVSLLREKAAAAREAGKGAFVDRFQSGGVQ